jgi:hypothetical protein
MMMMRNNDKQRGPHLYDIVFYAHSRETSLRIEPKFDVSLRLDSSTIDPRRTVQRS